MKLFSICLASVITIIIVANCYHPQPQVVTINHTDTVRAVAHDTLVESWSAAVAKIESGGNPHARRFEPTVFLRLTGKYAATFSQAAKMNWHGAMLSTSFGKHQLLGTNYRTAGFATVEALANASEPEQDSAFARFVRSRNLIPVMRARRYAAFAAAYNGAGYRRNRYDKKLAAIIGDKS